MIDSVDLTRQFEAFDFGSKQQRLAFNARLAEENGWSAAYTERVVTEYRRFLLLAASVPHAVTPSEQVDQAWHLHILHSAQYREFCREVFGRELDHGPSLGGPAERARFARDYERTLASYEKLFGQSPPDDIWPDGARRFGDDLQCRRVNVRHNWVVPKPKVWLWVARCAASVLDPTRAARRQGALIGAVACGLTAAACAARPDTAGVSGPAFLGFYITLWVLTLLVALEVRRRERSRHAGAAIPDLDPYEVAYLAGGETVALNAALTTLVARDALSRDDAGRLRGTDASLDGAHPFELQIRALVGNAASGSSVDQLRERAGELTTTRSKLQELGLMGTPSRLPFWLALVAPVVGGVRILTRVGSDKPIGWLALLCLLALAVAFLAFKPDASRTPLGDAALARERERNDSLRTPSDARELALSGSLPLALALFGIGALDVSAFPGWMAQLTSRGPSCDAGASGYGGGGDASGCGDGGCGGGCGGCGGCGG